MVRLLHTGDIHLGKQFPWLRGKADEYRNQLVKTFEKIVDLAESEGVSLLLISGDLFDSNRLYGLTIGRILYGFRRLEAASIKVCIIPGCQDDYSENSLYRSLMLPPNIAIFTPDYTQQTYEDLDLTVYGMVPETQFWQKNCLQGLSLVQKSRFHVGMAHCSINLPELEQNDSSAIEEETIAGSGLDYLALGHWHSFQDCSQGHTAACYCGSPEPVEMDQRSCGNVVMVTLEAASKAEFHPISIGTKKCDSITIDVSPLESTDAVIRTLEARSDPDLILEVILAGVRKIDSSLNIQEIERTLGQRFFNLRVVDMGHLDLETIKSGDYPDKTVIGRYLRIMESHLASASTEEDKTLYEEALKLGSALLHEHLQVIE